MSDHHLAQTRLALYSVLQDKPSRIWDAVRAKVIPSLSKRGKLVLNELSRIRGTPREPEVAKAVLLIPGKIDRGPSDGRSVIVVAADNGYTWQIRKFGHPLKAHGGYERFDNAEEAWNAGLVALGHHRAAAATASVFDGSPSPDQ